jgi:hypothetical protein
MRSVPEQESTMPDEPTQPSPTAAPPASSSDHTHVPSDRRTVSVPPWLAAALVVLLGLAIGAAGFAIGRVTDGGHGGHHAPIFGRGPERGPGRFGGFGPRRGGGFGPGSGTGGGTTPTTGTPPSTAA